MQDEPTPIELTKAVANFLRKDITPMISGHNAFRMRVAVNILDLVTRQLTLEEGSEAKEVERLTSLLGMTGSVMELNRVLAERIAKGELDLSSSGLAEHLWQTTMDKLAVDRPTGVLPRSFFGLFIHRTGAELRIAAVDLDLPERCHSACGRSIASVSLF